MLSTLGAASATTHDVLDLEVMRMAGIPGPAQGEAGRLGLTADAATEARTGGREDRARLDEEELRALERAEYYGGADPLPAPSPSTEGILERLWHRLRRSG